VVGIGPIVELYPIFNSGSTPTKFSLYSFGGQIRYQARYFREQVIVPVVGYTVESFYYSFTRGATGNLISSGPTAGLWFLLNFLEPQSASQFYINSGVLRSYLILEYRNMRGSDANVSFSGGSYYFGVRCEF
jgi:hypothetical protein